MLEACFSSVLSGLGSLSDEKTVQNRPWKLSLTAKQKNKNNTLNAKSLMELSCFLCSFLVQYILTALLIKCLMYKHKTQSSKYAKNFD